MLLKIKKTLTFKLFTYEKKKRVFKQLLSIDGVLNFYLLVFQIKIMSSESWTLPPKQGLYDPTLEREACGVGFIVAIDGKRSHKVSDFKLRLSTCKFKERTGSWVSRVWSLQSIIDVRPYFALYRIKHRAN